MCDGPSRRSGGRPCAYRTERLLTARAPPEVQYDTLAVSGHENQGAEEDLAVDDDVQVQVEGVPNAYAYAYAYAAPA